MINKQMDFEQAILDNLRDLTAKLTVIINDGTNDIGKDPAAKRIVADWIFCSRQFRDIIENHESLLAALKRKRGEPVL